MTTLLFNSEEALRVALTSELIPEKVQRSPATVQRDAESIAVSAAESIGRRQLTALKKAGVEVKSALPRGGQRRDVSCWAEIVSPLRVPETELSTALVLFALPDSEALLDLAAELLRLGCDRQELSFRRKKRGEPAALLKAVAPPYYTVARVLDGAEELRAFVPAPPGQERVLIEAGFSHPMVSHLRPDPDALLLIEGDGRFVQLDPGSWTNLYQLLEVQLPGATVAHEQGPAPDRLKVTLRLAPGARQAAPTLWVLGDASAAKEGEVNEAEVEDPVAVVDRLVQQLPQRVIDQLMFAVATREAEPPLVLLRARHGRGAPPVLDLPATAFATWLELDNLFVPADAVVEPPLRRQSLQRLLAADPDAISWLAPRPKRGFELHRVADSAFSPLSDWVDYIVHDSGEALAPWVRSVTFDFEAFESIGVEWSDGPARSPREPEEEPSPRRRRRRRDAAEEVEQAPAEPAALEAAEEEPAEPIYEQPLAAVALIPVGEQEQALARIEQEFLALAAPIDAPERIQLWCQLGELNARLGRAREAQLCWTRALWEVDAATAAPLAARWTEALSPLANSASVADLLAEGNPSSAQVQALAAQLTRAALAGETIAASALHAAQMWLDSHDDALDVRSLWLARAALSQMVGGDALSLMRTRDRIIGRLAHGLSVARDVPSFLRFCGSGPGEDGAPAVDQLAAQLEQLLKRVSKTRRKRSPVEAPEQLTRGYVQLVIAHGFARLGRDIRARELVAEATGALPDDDPIHRYLVAALSARVAQALEGQPPETPLPAEVSAQLNDLERFDRYKVDRLRQASDILEPHERLDPVRGFQHDQSDPRGEEFAPMRAMSDHAALAAAVADVMRTALADGTELETRVRLFDGVMDFFPMLREADAVPHLTALIERVDDVELPRRCQLLSEALMLAGLFSRGELVHALVDRLTRHSTELGSEHVAEVGRTLDECLRSLRRIGQRERAAELLAAGAAAISGDSTDALVARLQLAAGLADLGQPDAATSAIAAAKKALGQKTLILPDRLRLTRAISRTLSYLPPENAFAGLTELAEQLPQITDSFNTNSHFCLAVIQFVESLVLGYASEELALGQQGRRWLDDDEYMVRRRLHRDLQAIG